jgi:hypothetical protein
MMIAMGAAPRWPLRIYFNEVVKVEALQKREHKCKVEGRKQTGNILTHIGPATHVHRTTL